HERSLNIDFLLGYLRQLLPRRPDLKVIITSATIDAERFAKHFAGRVAALTEGSLTPTPDGTTSHSTKHDKAVQVAGYLPVGEGLNSARCTNSLSPRERAGVREPSKPHAPLPEILLTHARELRKNTTDAEQLLWNLLRDRQVLDAKFRRQHPMGSYILDFYCHEAKLAIELDGGLHGEDAQLKHDEKRSAWLKEQGITVLRFWNNEALANTEGMLQTIFDWLNEECPLTRACVVGASAPYNHGLPLAGATPLPTGEGLTPEFRHSGSLSPPSPSPHALSRGEREFSRVGVREHSINEAHSQNLNPAPIIQVSGRTYPVEVRYRPPQQNEEGDTQDVPQAICSALDELSIGGLRGDVLVFLPGEREIRDTAEALRKHQHKGIEILPLYSRLSIAEQDRVFKAPSGMRRVVLATNVAETSLTVPNIGYVIDSGLARINRYSVRQKVEQLRIENIARAAANQRAGRCGRVMSGICIRLYEEADFLLRPEFTDAEIFRVSLATVILRMSALGLGEVEAFPFIEPPGSRAIADGYQLLVELGAIAESVPSPQPSPGGRGSLVQRDDKPLSPRERGWGEGTLPARTATRQLTPLGHELAKLPLDPKVARLLLAGRQYHCLNEILIIASALALQDPRDRPADKREAADAAHQRFNDERSDFLAYIKLWAWFQEAIKHKKTNKLWAQECREKFLSPIRLREWHELHQQLHAQVSEMGMFGAPLKERTLTPTPLPVGEGLKAGKARLDSACRSSSLAQRERAGGEGVHSINTALPATYEQIHKALLTGLLGNIGCRSTSEPHYLGPREIKFFIASNSVLAKKGAKWVFAAEIVETTKLFARCMARVEPEWLEEVGAHLIKRSYFDAHWEKKAAQVAAWERSTLFGLLINPKKRVHYGPMNPEESREVFIRQALVNGEFNT
ncbi:MAG: DUF3418 domain-containing protein, partial [Sideroxydans sp.]